MKTLKTKVVIALIFALFIFFFSNDFGLVDIDKTAIIVALAVDKGDSNPYEVTAEIAVPEATDQNSETKNAQVTGRGDTIGEALKEVSDLTGWFPQLNFCNLIMISNDLSTENVIKILNYFAVTFRVQDSCLIAMSDGPAKSVLEDSSPLDDIASFAIQKILLKQPGFDKNVLDNNVKDFCVSYYNPASSSYMPIISRQTVKESSSVKNGGKGQNGGSSSESGQGDSSSNKSGNSANEKIVFSARRTALFKNGIKTGELSESQTLALKILKHNVKGTTYPVEKIYIGKEENQNYLLTILKNKAKIKVMPNVDKIDLDIQVDVFCKLSDTSGRTIDPSVAKNTPLPQEVQEAFKNKLTDEIFSLIDTSVNSNCDFLNIERNLYKYHQKDYYKFKDKYLSVLSPNVSVNVSGQK